MSLRERFKLKEAKDLESLDHCAASELHRKIIKEKPFLRNLYTENYQRFQKNLGDLTGKRIIELGSGGGFIKEILPSVETSDIQTLETLDHCFSALKMPFEDQSIDAFIMIDVFHHVPDAEKFLSEMNRCLKRGGIILMVEPANTLFARWIYQSFHHEPFNPDDDWQFESAGPMTSANGALPWIVFSRDKQKLSEQFPSLVLQHLKPHTPFRYLISGGVSMKQLLPSWTYSLVCFFELLLSPISPLLGMFYDIKIVKE